MSGLVVVSSHAGVLEELRSAATAHPPAAGVTVIAPGGATPPPTGDLESTDTTVRVIWLPVRADSALRRRVERHVVGRTLLRLSPLDRGRQLARRVRRSPDARAALERASALVAADRDAVLTVWRAARRADRRTPALFGLAAGVALIRRG